MKILLHLGMPKCGSSALQTYLSKPAFEQDALGRCAYLALHADGKVLAGKPLFSHASSSPHAYCSSHPAELLAKISDRQKREARTRLLDFGKKYETLVLSCEGWGSQAPLFGPDSLFADPAFEVSALAYVRPQVEWMNSAWWQWGAWTTSPSAKWIRHSRPKASWHTVLQQWAEKPWIRQLDIRLVEGDVVQDFMAQLGFSIAPQPRANQSLPGSVLKLFQRHRHLRPGPHDSAIEFALARHLRFENHSTPWVIRPKLIEHLLDYYRADNERLAASLPASLRENMRNDARWWLAGAYAERAAVESNAKTLSSDELEKLAVTALEAIYRMDAMLRGHDKPAPAGKKTVEARPEPSDLKVA